MFPKFKIRVQRNKLLFNCANIFKKKALGVAHIPPICAKNQMFFNIFSGGKEFLILFSSFDISFHNLLSYWKKHAKIWIFILITLSLQQIKQMKICHLQKRVIEFLIRPLPIIM